jgi:hypothetical protein
MDVAAGDEEVVAAEGVWPGLGEGTITAQALRAEKQMSRRRIKGS